MNWPAVALSRVRLARHQLLGGGGGAMRRSGGARPLLAIGLGFVLAAIVTIGLVVLFVQLRNEGAGAAEASTALALLLTATLVGLLAFDLHEVVSALVLDSDLEFLRRAPIPAWALFAIKLADTLPRTSVLLVILAAPSLVAFGTIFPVAPWCWAMMPPALLALWAIALGIGVAISVLLLRIVPARTAREVLGLLSTFTIFALWLGNSFLLPRVALESANPRALLHVLTGATLPGHGISPGAWVAAIMAAGAANHPAAAVRGLALTLAAATIVLIVAGAIAAHSLDAVQSRVFGSGVRAGRRTRASRRFALVPNVLDALLVRDLRLYLRDWTVMGDILVASVLWTLLPVVSAPLMEIEPALLARAMLLALTVALGYEIATRAIPFERGAIAWMRLAPVSSWRWVLGRFLSTLALATPIVAVATFAVAMAMRLDAIAIAGTLALVLPALVTSLAIGLWTGAAHGNYAWTHPRAMLTLTGRALATLLLLVQAIGWLVAALVIDRLAIRGIYALPLATAAVSVVALLFATARHLGRRQW